MPSKSVPLSVRVSDEDAAFLSGLQIDGATTPSEKLRALLRAERRLRGEQQDPMQAAEMVSDLLRPSERRLRRCEAALAVRSEPAEKLYARLPELLAFALAGPPALSGDAEADAETLAAWEGRWLDSALATFEDLLKAGLASEGRSFGVNAVASRTKATVELVELLKIAQKQREGEEL